ncbi:SRPBCC domain-containing protein [Solimonas sp. K1W22B-7]|uniref:SRPBCC family protein n=1 Tax=Solimonas sp. K1W22B-7 TaxID=2303331 RepID=UPI000E3320FA|nr:SRPBCC domain-containing protein [Solimonas sp. K1W22B-7]AXQ30635.1 SRPBCC domain-containing protein [Solimonas sp. K1W22B-7]
MTSLTLVRRIAARPSIVFDAFVTPEAMVQWWSPDDGPVLLAEADPRVGGRMRVRFRTLDGKEHEGSGLYLEIERPRRIVMAWHWSDGGELEEEGKDSRIEIELREIDSGTELTFTHAQLKTEASLASHEAGWNGALDKLVAHFSRGDRHAA